MDDSDLPDVCPECGARDAYERRFVTGGGWRAEYRCVECGRRARRR
ncbi:hypothetical protein [Halopelagius fulvigenes]|uniref:Small CPxCG-related zinc finger protein n=1 Tax=Halopelagius fulvigenes TaxID=1198324 RepID=A0ABD5TYP6_9EURY